jgi:tetratricopeptide (TPR) repeat protein
MKYQYIVLFIISLVTLSCKSTKELAQKKDKKNYTKEEKKLTSEQKLQIDYYFFEGLKEKNNDNFKKAAENFEKAIEIDNTNHAFWYELAQVLIASNQTSLLSRAVVASKKTIELSPENVWYQQLYGSLMQKIGNLNEAEKTYLKLIELQPNKLSLIDDLASIYVANKKFKEAVELYSELEKKYGKNDEFTFKIARTYVQAEKYNEAITTLEQNIIGNKDANSQLISLLANLYNYKNQTDKAISLFESYLNIDKYPELFMPLADLYYKVGEDTKALQTAEKIFPNNAVDLDEKIKFLYNNLLVQSKLSDENYQAAFNLCDKLIEQYPNEAKVYALKGDFYYQQKKLNEARVSYSNATKYDKTIFSIWQQLFSIDIDLSNFKGLKETTEEAKIYFPNQPIVFYFNGIALSQLKDYKASLESLKEGLDIYTDNENLTEQLKISIAESYYRLGIYEESDRYFEEVLANNPTNALALNNYAYYLSERDEKLNRAKELSEKSLSLEPDNSSYLDTYGWILYKLGDLEGAEKYIKMSLEKSPESAEVLEHYGDLLFEKGNTKEAMEYWKKAKEKGGDSEELLKKIKTGKINE